MSEVVGTEVSNPLKLAVTSCFAVISMGLHVFMLIFMYPMYNWKTNVLAVYLKGRNLIQNGIAFGAKKSFKLNVSYISNLFSMRQQNEKRISKCTLNARNFQKNIIVYTAIDIVLSIQHFNLHIKYARLKKCLSIVVYFRWSWYAWLPLRTYTIYSYTLINAPVSMER